MTDNEKIWRIWQEACRRVGIDRCSDPNCKVRTVWTTTGYMVQPYHPPHGPPLGDDHATVAMLEWLINANDPTYPHARERAGTARDLWAEIFQAVRYHEESLPLAVAAAVVAKRLMHSKPTTKRRQTNDQQA